MLRAPLLRLQNSSSDKYSMQLRTGLGLDYVHKWIWDCPGFSAALQVTTATSGWETTTAQSTAHCSETSEGGGFWLLTAVSVNSHTDTTTTTTAWWMWRQARRTGGLPKGINNTVIPPVRRRVRPLSMAGLHTIAGATTPIQLFLPLT